MQDNKSCICCIMKYLYLDDFRHVYDSFRYTGNTIYNFPEKWDVVRSYAQFVKYIKKTYQATGNLPELISYDHDLHEEHYEYLKGIIPYDTLKEKTGYHCIQWLLNFCKDNNLKFPKYLLHTQNEQGYENMEKLINENCPQ